MKRKAHLQQSGLLITLVSVAGTTGILTWFLSSHTKSAAIDLAHNYALTHRIRQQGIFFSGSDPSLGEMNVYPRGAHLLSSAAGDWVGSTFFGVHLVALVAVGIIFGVIAIALSALPKKLAVNVAIILLIFLVANSFGPQFELHGSEIVGTFFFSQLLGFSLLSVGLLVAGYVEKYVSDKWAVLVLSFFAVSVATIHLLPALIGLGVAWLLSAISALTKVRVSSVRERAGYFLLLSIGPLMASIAVLLLPSTRAMRQIAEHDGGLTLNGISYPWGVFTLIALTGIVSAF